MSKEEEMFTLKQLQDEQRPWIQHNFGGRSSWKPLVGAMEELGELSHAHLKAAQGIRNNEDHDANGKDAVADIIIYLADYCSAKGWDLHSIVEDTWNEVKKRDWIAYPDTGMRPGESAGREEKP